MLDQSPFISSGSDDEIERLFFGAKLESTIIDSRVAHIYEHCLVAMLFNYLCRECRTRFPGIFLSYGATTFLGYIMFQFATRDEQAMGPVRQFFRQSRSVPGPAILEQCQRSVEAEVGMTYQIDDEEGFRDMINRLTKLRFEELPVGQPVYSAVVPKRQVYRAVWLRQRRASRSFRRIRVRLMIDQPDQSDYALLLSTTDLLRDSFEDVVSRVGAYAIDQWLEVDRGKPVVNLTYLVHSDVKLGQLARKLEGSLPIAVSQTELVRLVGEVKKSGSTIFYPDQLYNLTGQLATTEATLERYLTPSNLRQTLDRLYFSDVKGELLPSGYYNYENQADDYPR